jgi:hypothetical protein
MSEHAYRVRLIVKSEVAWWRNRRNGRCDVRYFRPACDCGWTGEDYLDELDAFREAFAHATGKEPEDEVKPVRMKRDQPRQDEALFERDDYDKKARR